MRSEFSESPCQTPICIPVVKIHHAGEAGFNHRRPSSTRHPTHILSPGPPAPSYRSLWAKTKYGQGYIKIHTGTTTHWEKKGSEGQALSEGTKHHNEDCRGSLFLGGQADHIPRSPHHPFFFCGRCPQNCYYEVKCFTGCLVLAAKMLWRKL